MAASKKDLTHAEIWDDSALLKSWDEAVKEYKKYHSLAAKGEKIPVSSITGGVTTTTTGAKQQAAAVASVTDKKGNRLDEQLAVEVPIAEHQEGFAAETSTAPADQRPNSTIAGIPEHLMQTVQNEDLKNLMMSWYYAGYYTGLYEGKQQAIAAIAQQGE